MNMFYIIKRSYYSIPPNASKILNKIRSNTINNFKNNLYANENTSCYDCYNIVKKNNLDYLPILSNNNHIIGVLSKYEIKREVQMHIFNEEEEKEIRDSVKGVH
tara:strand:+ start:125 stop:436 length:312 start_codon:yes stop_codon:yes gene_type:complete